MMFHSVSAFVHMGGFADFVWPAYGIVTLGLLGNGIYCARRLRLTAKKLQSDHAS